MEFIHGFAKVNGTKLYYEVIGQGHPLILIHSGYTDNRIWNYQIKEFSKYFQVIRYDIRGFGKSEKPQEPFYHHHDLYELLKLLKIENGYFLGVSMGGGIAIDFTLEYPSSVDALILSGSSLNGYKVEAKDVESIRRYEAGLSLVKKDENYEKAIEFLLNDPMWKQEDIQTQEHLRKIFTDTSLKWILQNYVKQIDPPAVERLSEIQIPTLMIRGRKDSIPIKEIFHFIETKIVDVRTQIINGTGHLPNMDKPQEFNDSALNFLLNLKSSKKSMKYE